MLKSSKTLQNRVCPNYPIECVPSFEPKTFWSHFTKEFEQLFENLRKICRFSRIQHAGSFYSSDTRILTQNAQGFREWNELQPHIDVDRTHSTRSRQSLYSSKLAFVMPHIMF